MQQRFLDVAQQAARVAGQVLQYWSEKFTVSEKGPADLVTEADVAAQEAIHQVLHSHFPDHGYLGEEGLRRPSGAGEFRWVIDPLDGTSNYVHRFPYYCVSIGLQCERELIVGVVYDPTRDEMFTASRGGGACLNGRCIRVSQFTRLNQALVIASFPHGVNSEGDEVARFLRVLPHAQSVQRSGSAALNLAYIASGRLDAYWSSSLKPWDMAAGALILSEAGGRITQLNGAPLDIEIPSVLATNGSGIHDELRQLIAAV